MSEVCMTSHLLNSFTRLIALHFLCDHVCRLVAAIRFEQELADAYFHMSGSRHGLGKAVMTFLIEPTVKAIVQTGEL